MHVWNQTLERWALVQSVLALGFVRWVDWLGQ